MIDKGVTAQVPNTKGNPRMFNSLNVSALLDPSQELSLDDLDLVLGGNNAVSAAGSGDDQQQQQGSANALDLRTSPVTGTVNVTATSTETHTGGEGPIGTLADTVHEIGHEAVDLAHKAGEIIYDTVHPIGEALGQLGHDVIMAIDHAVVGSSSSPGTSG
jgi:hypothetical protein